MGYDMQAGKEKKRRRGDKGLVEIFFRAGYMRIGPVS